MFAIDLSQLTFERNPVKEKCKDNGFENHLVPNKLDDDAISSHHVFILHRSDLMIVI